MLLLRLWGVKQFSCGLVNYNQEWTEYRLGHASPACYEYLLTIFVGLRLRGTDLKPLGSLWEVGEVVEFVAVVVEVVEFVVAAVVGVVEFVVVEW